MYADCSTYFLWGMYIYHIYIFGRLGWLKFVTISQTNYDDFCNIYPKLQNNLIYNGRAPLNKTDRFKNVVEEINSYRLSERTKVFLHIARCNPQKNQKLLIDAFNRYLADGTDAILLIIGAHFDDTKEGILLKKSACDKIHFLGTRKNVSDYIMNSDAFCLSSIFEGMPITLIECLNSGLPVISTSVCGIVDVVKDGKNGILCKDLNVLSYVDSLKRFEKEQQNIKLYCIENKNNSPFTIKICAKNYIDLFN